MDLIIRRFAQISVLNNDENWFTDLKDEINTILTEVLPILDNIKDSP